MAPYNVLAAAALIACISAGGPALAQSQNISRGDHQRASKSHAPPPAQLIEIRSIDGSGNNIAHPGVNASGAQFVRIAPNDYEDGVAEMRATGLSSAPLPNPRTVSNVVVAQSGDMPNRFGTSDWIWQWGQFIDHDLTLSDGIADPADMMLPPGDMLDDGSGVMAFQRAEFDMATGTGSSNPRQQVNELSGWIDASNVYGSSQARADELRSFSGGRLKTSPGDLLPFNINNFPNANGPAPDPTALFIAGDVRSNEQVSLTSVHTLFVREHNRLADRIAARNPSYTDEEIYQKARRLVGAELQIITYNEFLPALLGSKGRLKKYRGYDPTINAGIRNEFSVAAYRLGHSALSPMLRRLDANGNSIGDLPLRSVFFNAPTILTARDSVDPFYRGLSSQRHQAIDAKIIDDVRNFLFGPPGAGGFDLAALNIHRGRDHGVPGLNDVRVALGLKRHRNFADITKDRTLRAALASTYADVDDVDLWVGGLSETPVGDSQLGETVTAILILQFTALRDGDRFWYQRYLTRGELSMVGGVRLSDIIARNSGVVVQKDVFYVSDGRPKRGRS
jgi:hypothetical protein